MLSPTGPADPAPDELSPHRRRLVLATCCLSTLMVSLDANAVDVALPDLQRDLSTGVSELQWVLDSYTLVLASFLMLGGSMADRLGRRRVFRVGLVVFTVGSVLCAVAPTAGWLIVFRALQAVGGSMLNPVAMSIITNTFTDRAERARAIGVWGGVVGVSMSLGLLVGGVLVTVSGWRGVFWVNLPVGALALVLTTRYVVESRAPRARRPDPVGQVLVVVGLATLTFGIVEGDHAGWDSPTILACFTVAAAAFVGLVGYERHRVEPLVDPRFFRSVPFSGAVLVAVASFGALGGFVFLSTLQLQNARGLSPFHAGLFLVPLAVMGGLAAPIAGRLVARRGPRTPMLLAGAALTTTGLLHTLLGADENDVLLVVSYMLFGTGFGLVTSPITNTAVSSMPRTQAGVAAAVASTSKKVGTALGVAVIGAVLPATTAAWWVLTGCGACVLVVSLASTGPRAHGTAERVAARLGGDAAPVAEDGRQE